jgi:hypothetical protein
MLRTISLTTAALVVFSLTGAFAISGPQSAQAQPLQGLSCTDLWFERNQIYAQNGHCFKTRRGKAAFGPGCFPPYGRLSTGEQRRVDRIRRQERRMGCRSGSQAANPPPPPPSASIYAGMSCNDLWYERNSIYARNGHCFKSARGRASFGPGCFPPYGKLGRRDQREVGEIKRWEGIGRCR